MIINYIQSISLERPWLLIVIVLPFIFSLLEKIKTRSLTKYADQELWPWAINISEQHFKSKKLLRILAWIFLAIAISGPKLPGYIGSFSEDDIKKRNDISIILIADLNGIEKINHNLYLIKLSDFINGLKGEKISIISLTSSASLISPLTNDYTVSSFYLANLFKVIETKRTSKTNNLLKALRIAYKEIKRTESNKSTIIYWSDIARIEMGNEKLRQTKKFINKLTNIDVNIIPVWNQDNNAADISSIFGDNTKNNSTLEITNIYQERISKIKSANIFDKEKKYGYQELFSSPLLLGILLLILSYTPLLTITGIKNNGY